MEKTVQGEKVRTRASSTGESLIMQPKFPIRVRAKDSGEEFLFASVFDVQFFCEKIDIENEEYEAWDSEGRPVKMSVQKPVWIHFEVQT